VIKFVSDLQQVGGLLRVLLFSPSIERPSQHYIIIQHIFKRIQINKEKRQYNIIQYKTFVCVLRSMIICLFWIHPSDLSSLRSSWLVLGFTIACAISSYHYYSCEFASRSLPGVLETTLCDKVCQWLATGRLFSRGTPLGHIILIPSQPVVLVQWNSVK
jgi:hypothetical protein